MRNEERAASMKPDEIAALLDSHRRLQAAHLELQKELAELQRQIAWFKQQLFGIRSERYLSDPDIRQLFLGE
ncbi:MAG: hypothetical protein HC876_15120, partial [Chloroflexaceae bacterium]|nr:hypothetical protein [Chloroflexaceae bacterium]